MSAHRKNFDAACRMYEQGASVARVAREHGVSRQAMWKALKRRGVKFRPLRRSGKDNHFYRHGRGYSKVQKAVVLKVSKAVKAGKIVPQPCEVCGAVKRRRNGARDGHAHHDDYSKPLEVRWLCKKHHDEHHAGAA